MSKRRVNPQRAARATISLFLSQGVGAFFLFLESRSAPYFDAREASDALQRLIEERVHTHLTQMLAAVDLDDASRAQILAAKTRVAAARVVARLPRCASRSQKDFARWLERQIADAVEDGDDGDPHGGPAAMSPMTAVSESWALHQLPIPRAERDALVAAVLEELSAAERHILEAMQRPQATRAEVAAALGLTVFEAKQRHHLADARAHEIAVGIAMRAAGVPGTSHAKKAA